MFTRRQFTRRGRHAATTLAAPAILRAQTVFRRYPFSLGVAAGDPSPDGFVIWTRLAPEPLDPHGGMAMAPWPVKWEVASDERFATHRRPAARRWRGPSSPIAVHVEVAGLQPDRPYWYRFSVRRRAQHPRARAHAPARLGAARRRCASASAAARATRTAITPPIAISPARSSPSSIHYGDYIYEYRGGAVRRGPGWRAGPSRSARSKARRSTIIADYRRRYAQYKADPDLQRAHAAHAFFMTYDDHEIADNWVQDIDDGGRPPEIFRTRRAAALQAWYEHMPVRRALMPRYGAVALHRSARFGDLAEMDFLDTRQFRSDQPCGDGFKPVCAGGDAPERDRARRRAGGVAGAQSRAARPRWNCLAQQIMMMSIDRRERDDEPAPILNMDSWAGYEVPRARLLARMRGLDNVVVLTGDEHQNFAGLLNDGDRPVGGRVRRDLDLERRRRRGPAPGQRPHPRRTIPQLKFINDQRGYLTCDVTPDEWRTNYHGDGPGLDARAGRSASGRRLRWRAARLRCARLHPRAARPVPARSGRALPSEAPAFAG